MPLFRFNYYRVKVSDILILKTFLKGLSNILVGSRKSTVPFKINELVDS